MLLAFGILRRVKNGRLAMLLSWSFAYALLWSNGRPDLRVVVPAALAALLCWIKPNIDLPAC